MNTLATRRWFPILLPVLLFLHIPAATACRVLLASTPSTSYSSVNAAVAAAALTDTITIDAYGGVCNENVLVPNTHLRLILVGSVCPQGAPGVDCILQFANPATINGTGTTPTLDLRAKGVMVQNLIISGGEVGIEVTRNANAIIDHVLVQGALHTGIFVTSMAFAVITNTTIQNSASGIVIQDFGSANIGINQFEYGDPYAPNVIEGNQNDGITVSRNSTARIFQNTISIPNGTASGVNAQDLSSVRMGGNTITRSTCGTGGTIVASTNASVEVGTDTHGAPMVDAVPSCSSAIFCTNGAVVHGYVPFSIGNPSWWSFDSTCPNGGSNLTPHS